MYVEENGKDKNDYIARKGAKIGFAADDVVFPTGVTHNVAIKISYHDNVAGTLKLVYTDGSGNTQERTITANGTDAIKTATFFVTAKFDATGFNYDFELQCEAGKEIPVSFVRVVKIPPAVAATGVIVTPPTLALELGENGQLTKAVQPTNASNQFVTWSSSNDDIATVNSSSGLVTPVSLGKATITAKTIDGGFTDNCVVEVSASGQSPYGGTNRLIPGLIEGEHYDEGGQGIAFNDDDTKDGVEFRTGDNVDFDSYGSNGYCVGYTSEGEWLEYTVDVTTGNYDIVFHYFSGATPTGNLKVSLNGTELTTISGLESNGWTTQASVTVPNITITGGANKILRLEIVDGRRFNIDAIEFVPSATASVIETKQELINLYPNPVSDILNVEFANADVNREIVIFDIKGQMIHQQSANERNTQIDIASLNTTGVLIVKIKTNNQCNVYKIIVP
jgi:hypothetical protein